MNSKLGDLADFDWVSERAKCTPFKIFELLRTQAQSDMQKWNLLTAETAIKKTFTLESYGTWFAVVYKVGEMSKGVMFSITGNGVNVQDVESRTLLHEGILTISNDGHCRLRVGQTECSLWQFRKLALQDLFFVNREV
jgi:hypothetical protein